MGMVQTFGKEQLPQSLLEVLAFLQTTKILYSIFQTLEAPCPPHFPIFIHLLLFDLHLRFPNTVFCLVEHSGLG